MTIAIAGATGRTGLPLTQALVAAGVPVRALTRDPRAAAVELPAGAEPVGIDFDDPGTLKAALTDADQLFIGLGSSAATPRLETALLDAAAAAGARHVVKVSAYGPPVPEYPWLQHAQVEAELPGRPFGYTVLRPGAFTSLLAIPAPLIQAGAWGGRLGAVPVAYIDPRDIAAVAAALLLADPGEDVRAAYHLTGDRPWTSAGIAAELARQLGRPVSYADRTEAEQRAVLAGAGVPAERVELALGLDRAFAGGGFAEVTDTVLVLTGSAPRTVPAWIEENRALYGG